MCQIFLFPVYFSELYYCYLGLYAHAYILLTLLGVDLDSTRLVTEILQDLILESTCQAALSSCRFSDCCNHSEFIPSIFLASTSTCTSMLNSLSSAVGPPYLVLIYHKYTGTIGTLYTFHLS